MENSLFCRKIPQKMLKFLENTSFWIKLHRTFERILEVFVENYWVFFLISKVASITLSFLPKISLSFFEGGLEFIENGQKTPWDKGLFRAFEKILWHSKMFLNGKWALFKCPYFAISCISKREDTNAFTADLKPLGYIYKCGFLTI